ncbi:DUF5799 family protein [Haloarchaeobius sp. DFWS5]|uniref:DUF5799 family protein n=1 Tax=Haloarchaeobius sp. DFWS5 TaxID=3446114 RepID=UPI003EBE6229
MANRWTDHIVGERMTVDKEFTQDVLDSEFSNQEWDLIMSAVEFEVENAENPDDAHITVDDSNLSAIIPELENIQQQMQAMGGASGGNQQSKKSGGLFGSVKDALGMGGGDEERHAEREAAASELASSYAEELQAHLESKGRWEEICRFAAAGSDSDTDAAADDSSN